VDEGELLAEGLRRLQVLVGDVLEINPVHRSHPEPLNAPLAAIDLGSGCVVAVRDRAGGAFGEVLVEARQTLTPLQARSAFAPKAALMRQLTGDAALLIVAPWLSPRTREILDKIEYGYLDLTGNVSFRLRRPAVVLRTVGAAHDPSPTRTARQQLRGARAGRLVRLLVDVFPRYRATELAPAAGVSLSYVSRLLTALEDEALINRSNKWVVDVDWAQLLRARAAQYSLLDANEYQAMLAPRGILDVLNRIRRERSALEEHGPISVTGSVAAAAVAPVAVGGQLAFYVPEKYRERGPIDRVLGARLGLVRSEVGANVLVLEAKDRVVFERSREVDGISHVALSQLVLDCLSGSGRMPAEGEAVLEHMQEHEAQWRYPSLDAIDQRP